jgi:hypothetical protein
MRNDTHAAGGLARLRYLPDHGVTGVDMVVILQNPEGARPKPRLILKFTLSV